MDIDQQKKYKLFVNLQNKHFCRFRNNKRLFTLWFNVKPIFYLFISAEKQNDALVQTSDTDTGTDKT